MVFGYLSLLWVSVPDLLLKRLFLSCIACSSSIVNDQHIN